MGGGKSKSKSSSKGYIDQRIADLQIPYLEDLFGQAGDLFGGTVGEQEQLSPEVREQMGGIFDQMRPGLGQQLAGGAYSGVDPNEIIRGVQRSAQMPSQTGQLYENIMGGQGNVFLGGMEDMLTRQSGDALDASLRSLDQRAAAAGVGGGSPYRNLQQGAVEEAQQGLADRMGELGYDTFSQDLGLKLGIAQQADANKLQREQMLLNQVANKQGAMTGGFGLGEQLYGMPMAQYAPSMMPWQAMNAWANILGRPTVLSRGRTSGSSSGKGFGVGI